MNEKKANHQANIVRLGDPRVHTNADTLELFDIGGYQVVAKIIDVLFGLCYVLGWIILFAYLFAYAGHASVLQSTRQPNDRVIESVDQIAIERGAILPTSQGVGTQENPFLNIRIQPYGSPLLQEDSILLCGYPIEEFRGMTGPVEIRFEARAHRMFEGIGCHELISVDHWTPPQQKGW